MSPWVNPETGEVASGCPLCEDTKAAAEVQITAMERELRQKRARITKLENEAEREQVKKRDGAAWAEFLRCYAIAFPDKRLSAKGIKSATATKFFLRLDAGSDVEDTKDAIAGATVYPYVVFGKRVKTGSPHDLSVHPQDIVSVNNDANFDFLRDVGVARRASATSETSNG